MIFGVAVNGVSFDPATAEFWRRDFRSIWNEEAIYKGRGQLGMDWSNAHVQPTGAYHYHGVPVGLLKQLHAENKMVLVGWAACPVPRACVRACASCVRTAVVVPAVVLDGLLPPSLSRPITSSTITTPTIPTSAMYPREGRDGTRARAGLLLGVETIGSSAASLGRS